MTAVIVYYVKFGGWWRLKGVPCVVVGGWHFWHKCLRVWEGRRSRVECLPWFWKEQKGGGVGVANPLPSSLLSLANQLAQLNQVCMLCRITNGVNKWLVFSLPSSSPHLLWRTVRYILHACSICNSTRDWITSNLTFKGNERLILSSAAVASWIDLRSREKDPWCHSSFDVEGKGKAVHSLLSISL